MLNILGEPFLGRRVGFLRIDSSTSHGIAAVADSSAIERSVQQPGQDTAHENLKGRQQHNFR